MTAQLNRERLEKIESWHEKFGSGHNVMLPAEEAEAMARMLLAGMDGEPLMWVNENPLPANYPYAELFPFSKVDIVREFTVFAPPAPVVDDYFAALVTQARARADKAMRKFPQPNYVLNKVAEESGEVIKAVIHYTEGREEWRNVEGEIIDNLAMLIRLVQEGDQVIGFTPPTDCLAAMLKLTCTCPSGDGSLRWPCPDHPPEPLMTSTVPDGWKLVPVEPTAEMCKAGYEAQDKWPSEQCDNFKERRYSFSQPRYKAMLAAAPAASEQEV